MRKTEPDPFPDMVEFLGLPGPIDDPLYEIGSLFGIRGTWERLFMLLTFNRATGLADDEISNNFEPEMRGQFECELGRVLTARDWDALCVLAEARAKKFRLASA